MVVDIMEIKDKVNFNKNRMKKEHINIAIVKLAITKIEDMAE